jgi:hydrogenase maturation protease
VTRPRIAVIGVGNEYRADDGVGPAVLAELEGRCPAGVDLVVADGEPSQLLDAWAERDLVVVIDAVLCEPATPGRIHRTSLGRSKPGTGAASTHGLGIPDAVRLAEVLDLCPRELVVFAVEAADLGFGLGLSSEVAAAVPKVVEAVLAEVTRCTDGRPAQARTDAGAEKGTEFTAAS